MKTTHFTIFVCLGFSVLAWAVFRGGEQYQEWTKKCEEKGGVAITIPRGNDLCLKKDSIIDWNKVGE